MSPLGARLLRRRATCAILPQLEQDSPFNWHNRLGSLLPSRSLLATWSSTSPESSSELSGALKEEQKKRTVAVFWDLDNKPPKRVPPFEAALRLKEMAGEFGNVIDLVAYANHHAFSHVPTWVHEERRQRKVLDMLEATGEVKPHEPYICGVCGSKKKTHVQLTNHFKMLHETEQRKRMNRLDSLKGKKKQKKRFLENNAEKLAKYKDAARSIIYPKVGYGLMQDIRRAGVYVRTVKDEPQAADIALKEHIMRSIKKGVNCICLVSDDTDFKPELRMARERRLHTVVVGDLRILGAYADTYFSWAEVASGRAEHIARLINGQLILGKTPNSLELGLLGAKNQLEEVPDVELDSEWGSDSDGEDLRWRATDRQPDEEWNDDFESSSDELSGSDSELNFDENRRSKLHGCLSSATLGIRKKV
jgi:hypothetical protein